MSLGSGSSPARTGAIAEEHHAGESDEVALRRDAPYGGAGAVTSPSGLPPANSSFTEGAAASDVSWSAEAAELAGVVEAEHHKGAAGAAQWCARGRGEQVSFRVRDDDVSKRALVQAFAGCTAWQGRHGTWTWSSLLSNLKRYGFTYFKAEGFMVFKHKAFCSDLHVLPQHKRSDSKKKSRQAGTGPCTRGTGTQTDDSRGTVPWNASTGGFGTPQEGKAHPLGPSSGRTGGDAGNRAAGSESSGVEAASGSSDSDGAFGESDDDGNAAEPDEHDGYHARLHSRSFRRRRRPRRRRSAQDADCRPAQFRRTDAGTATATLTIKVRRQAGAGAGAPRVAGTSYWENSPTDLTDFPDEVSDD